MVFKKKITSRTEKILREKKKLTGLKEDEIIEKAVEEIPIENLLWIRRIQNR